MKRSKHILAIPIVPLKNDQLVSSIMTIRHLPYEYSQVGGDFNNAFCDAS